MLTYIPKEDRYLSDHGWLQSYFLFSFAEYFDPDNMSLGSLRVFNDDSIAPRSGFPMHSHRNMEIVTLMFKGELTHEDSMGNKATLRTGSIQRMSASTRVMHSEYNHGDEPIQLYQIWITPSETVAKPEYEELQADFSSHGITNLVGNTNEDKLQIHADASISIINLTRDGSLQLLPEKAFGLFCVRSGSVKINDYILTAGDQLRFEKEGELILVAEENVQVLYIEAN